MAKELEFDHLCFLKKNPYQGWSHEEAKRCFFMINLTLFPSLALQAPFKQYIINYTNAY